MASTIIYITETSTPIRPAWKKIPKRERIYIKTSLGVTDVQLLRTFTLSVTESNIEGFRQGFAREKLLRTTLSFEVLIQDHNGNLVRRTMQRMCPMSPFIRLI
jgi:hypothetical protein